MFKKIILIAALSSILVVRAEVPARAQTADDLARVEKELASQKAAAESLERKEQATEAELDDLRQKLIAASSSLQEKQSEQDDLEDRLGALEKELTLRSAVLGETRTRLATLTSALLQLSREPPELFLLREDSTDDPVHRTILLRSLLPNLREETTKLTKEIESYEQLRKQATAQKRLVAAAQQNLQWQRHNLDQLVKVRQGFLQKTQAEKDLIAKQLDNLTNEAKDLRQLMEKVGDSSWGKEAAKAEASARPVALKKGLKMPVSGKIIRDYGSKDEFGVSSDGVTVLSAASSPVLAPQTGRVVFAGPFRGYGKIVILQHPGGYHSFMAGFGRIDAELGQKVESGEPLGVLPAKGEGKPELYFEWRKGADPVDPTTQGLVARKG